MIKYADNSLIKSFMKQNICVYCGASDGALPIYQQEAKNLAKLIANQGRRLVYGGGKKGLMGVIADAALDAKGNVIGVIPQKLVDAETAHHGVTQLEIVDNIHERKAKMISHADAFIVMPGGTGTFEEFFEVWTWMQIGYHEKPVALFNVNHFYDSLLEFLSHAVSQGFIRESFYKTLIVSDDANQILTEVDNFVPKDLVRWIKK